MNEITDGLYIIMMENEKPKAVIIASYTGHDVARTSAHATRMLGGAGFDVQTVGETQYAPRSASDFFGDREAVGQVSLFLLNCMDGAFADRRSKEAFLAAIKAGAGLLCMHGSQVGFRGDPEMERLIGLLWRETASHGDYGDFTVEFHGEHDITRGIEPFSTKEELYCGLSNPRGTPLNVVAVSKSPYERLSRHGHAGTGRDEPVITVSKYGEGISVNFLLGHVWPFYTGHGLLENTLATFSPQTERLFVNAARFAAHKA